MPTIQQIDDAILIFIQNHMHADLPDKIMPFISWLGNNGGIWIAVALLLIFFKKYRSTGFLILAALLVCFIFNDILLKPLVTRLRPCNIQPGAVLLIPRPADFSFPSGHSSSSFAAAAIIFFKNRRWGTAAIVLASLIAFSRLYLYVHYPSDVAAGILLGVATAFFTVWIVRKYKAGET
jgi:undecaprenyl-diphosphatase